jgi:hypothetical protein
VQVKGQILSHSHSTCHILGPAQGENKIDNAEKCRGGNKGKSVGEKGQEQKNTRGNRAENTGESRTNIEEKTGENREEIRKSIVNANNRRENSQWLASLSLTPPLFIFLALNHLVEYCLLQAAMVIS